MDATTICSTNLKAPFREVDRKDMHLCHLPSLRERHHGAKRASYRRRPKGHPHQFNIPAYGSSNLELGRLRIPARALLPVGGLRVCRDCEVHPEAVAYLGNAPGVPRRDNHAE